MVSDEFVMGMYCLVTFTTSGLLFGFRKLLLLDSANSRLSKAAEYVRPIEIAAWVFMWYGVSVSMVMANRWLFHEWQGVGFPFPVLTTMVHMWLKFFVSRGIFWAKGDKPPHLDVSMNIRTVIPIGIATAGDILLSNLSFMYVDVTFYTIVKSGSLMWILLWAVAFKFEVMTPGMVYVVAVICLGLFLASWDENDQQFSLPGLLMILGASCFSGLRWALVQLLQQVEPACIDPLLVIFYISPASAISMTPMALLDILDEDLRGAHLTPASIGQVAGLILATGMFSFMLIFAEVKLLSITSSLSMGVLGTVKEIVQIFLAVLVFSDRITFWKIAGLLLAMTGSLSYKLIRGKPSARASAGDGTKGDRQQGQDVGGASGDGNAGSLLSYSAVSQQEVDEELRVFKYSNTEWELEGELEEFSSFDDRR
ncbi:unnamed protein product [Laminaria digitata]